MKPRFALAVLLLLACLWPVADVAAAPSRFFERPAGDQATGANEATPSIAKETGEAAADTGKLAKANPPASATSSAPANRATSEPASNQSADEADATPPAQTTAAEPTAKKPAETIADALSEGEKADGKTPQIGGEVIEWVGRDRRIKRVKKVPATIYSKSHKPPDKLIITDDHHQSTTELLGISDLRHYGARPEQSKWLYSGSKFLCELRHPIPGFGYAVMKQGVSDPLQFLVETDGLVAGTGRARIQSRPPVWKRFAMTKDLGVVDIEPKDKVLFSVPAEWVRQLILELKEGMQPTISFWDDATGGDDVVLTVSSFNFQKHLPDFAKCLANLLPYSFKDVRKRTVYFDYDKYKLSDAQQQRLSKLIEYVKLDETVKKVDITGFTDSVGYARYNRTLARRRANEVKKYLLAQGVPAAKLQINAKGEKGKKHSNRTAAGRSGNRRVEVTLIK